MQVYSGFVQFGHSIFQTFAGILEMKGLFFGPCTAFMCEMAPWNNCKVPTSTTYCTEGVSEQWYWPPKQSLIFTPQKICMVSQTYGHKWVPRNVLTNCEICWQPFKFPVRRPHPPRLVRFVPMGRGGDFLDKICTWGLEKLVRRALSPGWRFGLSGRSLELFRSPWV